MKRKLKIKKRLRKLKSIDFISFTSLASFESLASFKFMLPPHAIPMILPKFFYLHAHIILDNGPIGT